MLLVVARFRPPNKAELASGGESIVDFEAEDTCSISVCRERTDPQGDKVEKLFLTVRLGS